LALGNDTGQKCTMCRNSGDVITWRNRAVGKYWTKEEEATKHGETALKGAS